MQRTKQCWTAACSKLEPASWYFIDGVFRCETAYYSDGFALYANLVYGVASYTAVLDTSQTYTVEGGKADLRHYLARLGRKSRCCSRCLIALGGAIKLFVWDNNQRQLWQQQYSRYLKHVIDFVSPRV